MAGSQWKDLSNAEQESKNWQNIPRENFHQKKEINSREFDQLIHESSPSSPSQPNKPRIRKTWGCDWESLGKNIISKSRFGQKK